MSTNRLSLLVPDGLHTPSCGLSLWQHQDGEVPSAAAGPSEQQDKGKLYLSHLYNMFQQIWLRVFYLLVGRLMFRLQWFVIQNEQNGWSDTGIVLNSNVS